jgi:hypothetical protein
MIKSLSPANKNHKCTICECIFTEDEGGTLGDLGMLPVSFCPSCFSGLCEMVDQGIEREWVGLKEKDFVVINQSCLTKIQAAMSAESILRNKNT